MNRKRTIIISICAIFVVFGLIYILVKMNDKKAGMPLIKNIVPHKGLPEGGTNITIFGESFDQSATVNIGSKRLYNVKVSPTGNVINGTTPPNMKGKANIVVMNPDGTQSNPSEFLIADTTKETVLGRGIFDTPTKTQTQIPKYKVLERDVNDTPIKTQIEFRLLVSGKLSKEGLKILLENLYSETRNKKGFKFHDHPTSIAIWAYTNKKDTMYVASLLWMENTGAIPEIDIQENILSQYNASRK